MIKSPLRYPGGKSRGIEAITNHIPSFQEFREPFVGGGSVFIYLKQLYPEKEFWINDLYFKLFKFWQQSQTGLNQVIEQVSLWKKNFQEGKILYKFLLDNFDTFNDIEIAAAFFILNRITFSGISESGGYSQESFEKRFTQSSIERLEKMSKILTPDIEITNLDYSEVINRDGEDIFIFCDPPYFSATGLYGKKGDMHKSFDHRKFADDMKNCKNKWLITYDNSDYIKNLFSFAKIIPWDMTYGMGNVPKELQKKDKEIFIKNF